MVFSASWRTGGTRWVCQLEKNNECHKVRTIAGNLFQVYIKVKLLQAAMECSYVAFTILINILSAKHIISLLKMQRNMQFLEDSKSY